MQVSEIMTKGVKVVTPDTRIPEIARRMRDEHVGALPVLDNDRLIGVVTDRDIVVRGLADGRDTAGISARELMSEGVHYCYENQGTREVAATMAESGVRRLAVLNRDNQLVGLVSLGDLCLNGAAAEAGEALGEIAAAPPEPA